MMRVFTAEQERTVQGYKGQDEGQRRSQVKGAGELPQGKEGLEALSVDFSSVTKWRLHTLLCPVDHRHTNN